MLAVSIIAVKGEHSSMYRVFQAFLSKCEASGLPSVKQSVKIAHFKGSSIADVAVTKDYSEACFLDHFYSFYKLNCDARVPYYGAILNYTSNE